MFGFKFDVIMWIKENLNMEIDWEMFDFLNRIELQIKLVKDIVDVSIIYCFSILFVIKISFNFVFLIQKKILYIFNF